MTAAALTSVEVPPNSTPHRTRARASRFINHRAARAGERGRYAAELMHVAILRQREAELICGNHLPLNEKYTMNILLWVLQVAAALMYGASGVMKIFMFDKISGQVPSFGALPREAWMALGILELVCVVGLIVPVAFRWLPTLTVVAAVLLAIESLVFIGVHVKYNEIGSVVMSAVLGGLMGFLAYGRMFLKPIS